MERLFAWRRMGSRNEMELMPAGWKTVVLVAASGNEAGTCARAEV